MHLKCCICYDDDDNRMSIADVIRAYAANCNKSLLALESSENHLRITRAKQALSLQYRQNDCFKVTEVNTKLHRLIFGPLNIINYAQTFFIIINTIVIQLDC